MKQILSIITAFTLSFSVVAQNPVGVWEGKLNVTPTVPLRLVIEIEQEGETYSSKLISVDQGNIIIPCTNTTIENDTLTTTFTMIGAQYRATIDNEKLSGTFTQSGKQFPLIMTKAENGQTTKINRPQTPKAPYPYNIEEVTFTNESEGNTLSGTLTTPKTNEETPAVVLVSGSGSQNRDSEIFNHKPFWVIADYLSRNGIAVLRFDDRAVGKSSSAKAEATTQEIAYDAEAAMEHLRKRGDFSHVGVIGHSEGGLIAFLLAGESEYKTPDFIISMAGCGIRGAEILTYQTDYELNQIEIRESEAQSAKALNRAIFDIILESKELNTEVAEKIKEVLEGSTPANTDKEVAQEQIANVVKRMTNEWMYNFIKFDPTPTIKNIKCPVLAINGSIDRQVEAKTNLKAIESALEIGGNNQYEVVEYEGLNHLLQKAESGSVAEYGEIEETINTVVLTKLANWIKTL
ncbi:MAG: alpha/beta hydrolase [Rikenellaceae bacterium]